MIRTALLIFTILFSTILTAQDAQPHYGPVIKDYGPYFPIKDADTALPNEHQYKVVFDVKKSNDSKENHSRYIESVARFMNMHAANGVSLDRMDIAVVLHGASTQDALNNKAYKSRHSVDNPNLDLIKALADKGVKFYLCGQSAAFSGIEKSELQDDIDLALSAMTMLTLLQHKGYALLP